MNDRIPYTYLVKFQASPNAPSLFYYGVRYANGCHPNDLFKTYFTSCKRVNSLIKQHGLSVFNWEIRKIFSTVEQARNWEQKVLLKIGAIKRLDFINQAIGKPGEYHQGMLGKKQTEFQRETVSMALKGRIPWNKGKKCPKHSIRMRKNNPNFDGRHSWNKGKKCPEISARMSGNNHPMFGKPNYSPRNSTGQFCGGRSNVSV